MGARGGDRRQGSREAGDKWPWRRRFVHAVELGPRTHRIHAWKCVNLLRTTFRQSLTPSEVGCSRFGSARACGA
eukprot:11779497-Alexandrium_andersonii.AAC.1